MRTLAWNCRGAGSAPTEVVDILVNVQLEALAILLMVLGQLILVLSILDSLGPENRKVLLTLKSGWTKLCATKSGNVSS